jgi:hypothetical protein
MDVYAGVVCIACSCLWLLYTSLLYLVAFRACGGSVCFAGYKFENWNGILDTGMSGYESYERRIYLSYLSCTGYHPSVLVIDVNVSRAEKPPYPTSRSQFVMPTLNATLQENPSV